MKFGIVIVADSKAHAERLARRDYKATKILGVSKLKRPSTDGRGQFKVTFETGE